MVDEANIESHGLWQELGLNLGRLPEWKPMHQERLERMVERDKNHPSIIIWSMGNEAGDGETFDEMSDWLHERDPSRVVIYEGSAKGGAKIIASHSDIQSPMYWSASQVEQYLSEPQPRPIILIEYAHAMGNSNGNMKEFWDVFYEYEQAQGGFIWDWADQGIRLPVPGSAAETFFGYGGDVGPAAPEVEGFAGIYGNNFCMNGLLGSDQTPHPALAVVKKVMQPVLVEAIDLAAGRVRVTNLTTTSIGPTCSRDATSSRSTAPSSTRARPPCPAWRRAKAPRSAYLYPKLRSRQGLSRAFGFRSV